LFARFFQHVLRKRIVIEQGFNNMEFAPGKEGWAKHKIDLPGQG
jgi:hypothetical protein